MERDFVLKRVGLVREIVVDLMSCLICDVFVAVTRLMNDELTKFLFHLVKENVICIAVFLEGTRTCTRHALFGLSFDGSGLLSKSEGSRFLLMREMQ